MPKNEQSSLEKLLLLTGRQDRNAFRALYAQSSSRLYAVLIRILADERDAADALQEVYITIWNRAARFDPEKGKAMAWLATMTRNIGIDALRRRRPNHVSDEACAQLEDAGRSPFDTAHRSEMHRLLTAEMQSLPLKQREAIKLFYFEERPLSEVAQVLDAPLNTAKSWIRRGMISLRDNYQHRSAAEYL